MNLTVSTETVRGSLNRACSRRRDHRRGSLSGSIERAIVGCACHRPSHNRLRASTGCGHGLCLSFVHGEGPGRGCETSDGVLTNLRTTLTEGERLRSCCPHVLSVDHGCPGGVPAHAQRGGRPRHRPLTHYRALELLTTPNSSLCRQRPGAACLR